MKAAVSRWGTTAIEQTVYDRDRITGLVCVSPHGGSDATEAARSTKNRVKGASPVTVFLRHMKGTT